MDAVSLRELLDRARSVQHDDPVSARAAASQARVLARADEDPVAESEALYRLAAIAHQHGDIDQAFGLALEAVDLANQHGAVGPGIWAAHLIGSIDYQAANYGAAIEQCEQALDRYHAAGGGPDAATILNTIAAIYQSMGDSDRALETYEAAYAAAEPYGRDDLLALVLGNIARIRASRSEFYPAVAAGERAVALAEAHEPSIVVRLLADLAEAHAGLADHARADESFGRARHHLRTLDEAHASPLAQLAVLVAEGRVASQRGDLDGAISVLQAALVTGEHTGSDDYLLEIHDLLSIAFKRSGRFEEALEHRERHDELFRSLSRRAGDLRLRTLQLAHDNATARQQTEILRLRLGAEGPATPTHPVESVLDVPAHQLETFEQLALLTEFRDSDVGEHTNRVGDLAAEIAHAYGRKPEWCERLRLAARLHDIGKVAVPDSVLTKSGPLTIDDYEMMKAHTSMGHRILSATSAPLFQMAAEVAQSHHEWWDGSGYPLGLAGTSIPLSGRIVAIADVFDALCSKRAYKPSWPPVDAARFVISGSDGQFDPDLVEAFIGVLRARYPELGDELS